MNLLTRSRSKSQSQTASPKPTTPKSEKASPRPPSANRKKSSEIAENKAKRVRTGCLTCRERHLKCDEALGRCLNCRKSDRVCRRGVRLNFIDIQTVAPPHTIDRVHGAKVTFRDDSRIIASEYVGGFERYPPVQPESPIQERRHLQQEVFQSLGPDQLASLFQSVAHSFDPNTFDFSHSAAADFLLGPDAWHEPHLVPGDELLPHGTSNFARKLATKQYSSSILTDPEQVHLLQVFVEEVGPWIDSMDPLRHFTHILPFHAIAEPMLLKAFLACGARQLFLSNPSYGEEKASHYYEAATQDLMGAIQDPNRDSVLCAAASLALSVFEALSPQQAPQTNHIVGSRALIHECGWTAKTPGLGGACFWISVGMELLSCLHHGWTLSWNPDVWGVDMDMDPALPFLRGEDLWFHRILYICAKIANFRVTIQHRLSSNNLPPNTAQIHDLVQEWNHYSAWCDQWDKSVPRSMKPLGHIQPWQSSSQSYFPKIWLPKRTGILSELFYHTARIFLAKTHPMKSDLQMEMNEMQKAHAHDICGLLANTKDRTIPSVSIRCFAIAAECLETRETQEEALRILDTISAERAWFSEPIKEELKHTWAWPAPHPETVDPTQMHNNSYTIDPALSIPNAFELPAGVSNPLSNTGDFSMENHPYQEFYVAPHHAIDHYNYDPYLI